jgi:hypothetical protein
MQTDTKRRQRQFFDAPEDAMSPMPPELRRYYHERQLEHEWRGDWEGANRINQWLTGAFTTVAEFVDDHLPEVRKHFLRRLCKAGVILA